MRNQGVDFEMGEHGGDLLAQYLWVGGIGIQLFTWTDLRIRVVQEGQAAAPKVSHGAFQLLLAHATQLLARAEGWLSQLTPLTARGAEVMDRTTGAG
jgi:hypothetical protein